ncbi:2Fe-2S iron-sulfur cluster-binding protein [Marinobacter sp. CHS3-4]|uniref:2Fe-2S iron-sulfur cluster-binding protein n=1 Tax=Marinobacter sp. CHS3-4 TaxID=3045174 RepID=UPI0024B58439|nr:2Fe-2S iron-sulfur cluster-binding protein [Marinobacter sp. CHS3-4]MDI9245340.1 2Fe-2S iron-sulfur cluster-binding protein [Marinobacter sp. CHS3-4]
MPHKYAQIAFTDSVRQVQIEQNSRSGYAKMDQGEDYNHLLSQHEADFIQERDSFYMASVSETNWPYLQHRGGPKGFMRVLDASTLGFADFSGNRQYVSTGNFQTNDRIALFFMDYPNKRRLKLMGRVELVPNQDWETLAKLEVDHYRANVERAFLIHVEAFDWNCPQHITPRFTEQELERLIAPLASENERLKQQVKRAQTPIQHLDENGLDDRKAMGDGELPLVISGIRQLTPRVRAYELRDPGGKALPAVNAGSHLRVPVRLKSGELVERHYSICSNPRRRDIYEIAVLKDENGQGGSVALHETYHLGMQLNCHPAENHFSLHQDRRPAVLLAGGIGITPIKAMAQALEARGSRFNLHYAGRGKMEMAFRDRLERAFPSEISLYDSQTRKLDVRHVMASADPDSVFYVCGPQSLIDTVLDEGRQLSIDADRIRYERFSAAKIDNSNAFTVHLANSGKQIHVDKQTSLLDALLENGIDHPFSCKTGDCKTCAVKVLDGEVDHADNCLSETERTVERVMCPCVSRAKGSSLKLNL